MKKYIKEIQHNDSTMMEDKNGNLQEYNYNWKTVVTVDENGNYYQYSEVINIHGQPVRFSEYRKPIFEMGWKSVSEFLKSRMPGYKVIAA